MKKFLLSTAILLVLGIGCSRNTPAPPNQELGDAAMQEKKTQGTPNMTPPEPL